MKKAETIIYEPQRGDLWYFDAKAWYPAPVVEVYTELILLRERMSDTDAAEVDRGWLEGQAWRGDISIADGSCFKGEPVLAKESSSPNIVSGFLSGYIYLGPQQHLIGMQVQEDGTLKKYEGDLDG